MSLATGITISESIQHEFLENTKTNTYRYFKISLEGENLHITHKQPLTSDIEADFESLKSVAGEKDPAYFVVRLDTEASGNYHYVIILYVPDNSKVKYKMIFSSTVETVRSGLAYKQIIGIYRCGTKEELGYKQFQQDFSAKGEPVANKEHIMTEKERQLKGEKTVEYIEGGATTKGVGLPISEDAKQKLSQLASKELTLVTLKIDATETIVVDVADATADASGIQQKLPGNEPRFIVFRYIHEYEGKEQDPIVLIYSCPSSSKVKQRMIYSATKSAVTSYAASSGAKLEKSVEVSDVVDITPAFVDESVHPPNMLEPKVKFSKPKRPVGQKPKTAKPGQ